MDIPTNGSRDLSAYNQTAWGAGGGMEKQLGNNYTVSPTYNASLSLNVPTSDSNNSNSEGKETLRSVYITRAIKRWFIYCGVCPEGIDFTKTERTVAQFCYLYELFYTKIFAGPFFYSLFYGYGFDSSVCIAFGIAMFIQHLTFQNKVHLIIHKSMDAKEVLRSEEECKKLHEMVKSFDKNVFHFFFQTFFFSLFAPIVAYPIYHFISTASYVHLGTLLAGVLTAPFHAPMMTYQKFGQTFIFDKKEKEILFYIKVLEDLVLMDDSVDGDDVTLEKTRKRLKQIMRQKQKQYEFRTNERKKTMFYHPLNVITGSALTLVYIALLILRQRSNDIVLESFAFLLLAVCLFFSINVIFRTHAKQLAHGPIVFTKAAKKLKYLDFMYGVERRLGMRYEVFEKWLEEQKKIATVNIVGMPVNGESVKKVAFTLASLSSMALLYVVRDMIKL